jgi:hypothetical protein
MALDYVDDEIFSPELSKMRIFYRDLDFDKLVISNTKELHYAITQFADHGSLKIHIEVVSANAKGSKPGKHPEVISDKATTKRILEIMKETPVQNPFLVKYKGNLVSDATKTVLSHIVDEFKDHVTSSYHPDFGQVLKKNDLQLIASYEIDGALHQSEYFAVDSIFLVDLTDFTDSKTVNICIPEGVFRQLCEALGQEISFNAKYSNHGLHTIGVNIREDNPPEFKWFYEKLDQEGNPTGEVLIKSEGILTDLRKKREKQHLYKFTGFFTGKVMCSFGIYYYDLTLVGLRAFSIHDELIQKQEVRGI